MFGTTGYNTDIYFNYKDKAIISIVVCFLTLCCCVAVNANNIH